MRHTRLLIVVFLLLVIANVASAQEADLEKLIAESDPVVQAQIKATLNAFLSGPRSELTTNWEGFRELKALKELADDDKETIVKQLAIYVATAKSEEDSHVLIAQIILHVLDLPPRVPIRVLAPYLDAENRQLRGFSRIWFGSHDDAAPRLPPLQRVNYEDYLDYVNWKLARNEEVPAGFVRYIYKRSPGRALLVFAYAHQHGDVVARMQAIRKAIGKRLEVAPQQGKEPEAQVKTGQQLEEGRQARIRERRKIQLSEHIVSNAIWLKENEFAERFQAALPEATAELAKLAKHKEWWARLYVAYVMRQHRELRQPEILEQLTSDPNALVSEAAKSDRQ